MEYALDPNAAKKADVFSQRIEHTGKYLGIFTRAEAITSKNNATGIDFSFKSESGESSDYLTIWTHGKDGSPLRGFNLVMAIMTCLRVKSLKAEDGEVEKYDTNTQQRGKVIVPLFKDLMNKPVGLLIQMEEYPKNSGGTAWKPAIFAAFDKDEFTASEILNKSIKPETLAKMIAVLKDRPMKVTPAPSAPHSNAPAGSAFADFEDDIPFLFNTCTVRDTMGLPVSYWRGRYGKEMSLMRANQTDF